MEASEESNDVVHPEVRAHITSLVSALGGFSAEEDGKYVLGDSALEVLKDVKKWIRFYDEKTNRMDVARCLAEANIVDGDLLQILALWPENANNNRFKAKAALACLEILVPLTWPLERDLDQMTINHHRHLPVLQLAQLGYKRSIINFDATQILHTAVRVALPSMALPRNQRSSRDEGIIKLMLLFLRNIAMISPPPGVKYDGDESQISRSAVIDAFSYQDILLTILTLASNMGEDFNQEGVILMEIIFHLVKRVNAAQLFMEDKELSKAKSSELASMMSKEAAMHRPYNRKAPTRHNRWGTMIWVQREDGKMSTVTGQDALLDAATRQQKMDSAKVFRPARRHRKDEMEPRDLGPPVSLNSRARQQLRDFVSEFLDSGFNPLFQNVRKKLDERRDYVLAYHGRQFFYLISWFLQAERARRKAGKANKASQDDVGSFNLIASVLDQETFITLHRSMGESLDNKEWQDLCACMRAFTQILLTVQEMFESGNEEDEEIAENILNRIFYEEEIQDRVVNIVRTYKEQGFEYLDASTELTHTYLRTLEAYSKQNVDMQVRSRRRVRKKRKAARAAGEEDGAAAEEEDDSDNDEANAEKASRERKFDFGRYANKFIPQGVVDTFVTFTKYYRDLDETQLKRAHRYFYRIAFKQEMSVMLYRADIMQLFHSMIKGQEPLDKSCGAFKEWEELVKQIFRKCIRKVEERPALLIEMLFSKINATAHYLEYGYEKQTISVSQSRPGAELEFRNLVVEHEQQIAIAVGALLDKNLAHHVKWIKDQLTSAIEERRAWESAEKAMASTTDSTSEAAEQQTADAPSREPPMISLRPEDDARRTSIFKNSHLRLLMKVVGCERLTPSAEETPESGWVFPSHLTADQLEESLDFVNKAEFSPPTFEDGRLAEDQLRRKAAPRKRVAYDDDEGEELGDEDDILFPAGGPTARKADNTSDKPKKTRRRRRGSDAESLTEEQVEEKARARRKRELEKARRYKSELYVHASDDETDDERDRDFFEQEAKLRQRQMDLVLGRLTQSQADPKPAEKRKAHVLSTEEDEGDDVMLTQDSTSSRIRAELDEDEEASSDTDDTPMSSSPHNGSTTSGAKRRRLSRDEGLADADEPDKDNGTMEDADEDGDEDAVVTKQTRARPRVRAGFIVDSSDEE